MNVLVIATEDCLVPWLWKGLCTEKFYKKESIGIIIHFKDAEKMLQIHKGYWYIKWKNLQWTLLLVHMYINQTWHLIRGFFILKSPKRMKFKIIELLFQNIAVHKRMVMNTATIKRDF